MTFFAEIERSFFSSISCAALDFLPQDIEKFLKTGEAYEIKDGGIIYKNKVCIILGSEIETSEVNDDGKTGSAHNLCYFPTLENIKMVEKMRTKEVSIPNIERRLTESYEPWQIKERNYLVFGL